MAISPPDGPYLLDHVAFAVPNVAAVTPLLVGELGGRPLAAGPGIEFLWWQWEFARGGALEVLQPDGPPDSFAQRFLEARGPGIHHVTFKVPALAAAAARMRSLGFSVVGYSDMEPSWKEFFLHPKQAQGIVVQLAEAHPEFEPEEMHYRAFPASPTARAEPVDVVGLRVSATSEEDARRQWETVLGGACETGPGGLCFRWPDSPLGITVDVDPAAPEGPLAIEIAAPLPRALPEGPHPALGAAFVEVGGGEPPSTALSRLEPC
jgi:methylmalonyl-CoA/ethylmalonyl-CoA epimerase